VDYHKLGLENTWEDLLPLLSESEREKVGRFKFEADRIRSIVGICLIKSAVYRAFPGEEVKLETTMEGKPHIANRSGFEFNLSHSGRIIALAEDSYPVGVDVELVKDKDWKIFHRYLSDDEMTMIESAKDPEACFFEVWTVREAFSKEEGLGLKILDSDFTVDYSKREINYSGKKLYFYSFDHTADDRYKLSICSAKEVAEPEISFLSTEDWERCLREGLFSEIK